MRPIRQCVREPSLGHLQQYHEADPLLLELSTKDKLPFGYQLVQMYLNSCGVMRRCRPVESSHGETVEA
jgi:hypothetical protein